MWMEYETIKDNGDITIRKGFQIGRLAVRTKSEGDKFPIIAVEPILITRPARTYVIDHILSKCAMADCDDFDRALRIADDLSNFSNDMAYERFQNTVGDVLTWLREHFDNGNHPPYAEWYKNRHGKLPKRCGDIEGVRMEICYVG